MTAINWEPTRAAGLARLAEFVPQAARAYTERRNLDLGPNDRSNISALSPWLRRRLITEQEVVLAVLAQHSAAASEKFIQEVAWRTYWKGWLELRPAVLQRYTSELSALVAALETDRALDRRLDRAVTGRTGIACFDAWVQELRTIGWLHNHARMWFASIWIFTLHLPWQLGADFFFTHLLDADPASNTLSWRWVAGLHTQGKHYIARAENIDRNTHGRFTPYGQLNEQALPLVEQQPPVPITPLAAPVRSNDGPCALLLTEEDLHPESWAPGGAVQAIAGLPTATFHSPGSPAACFAEGALVDGLARAAAHFGVPASIVPAAELPGWLTAHGCTRLVTAQAPVGPLADQLRGIAVNLAAGQAQLVQLRRAWDDLLWPHATAGFFKFKSKLPATLAELSLAARPDVSNR